MNIGNLLPQLKNLSHTDKLKAIKFLAVEINQEQAKDNLVYQSDIVVLNTKDYQEIIEELEELEELRAYDRAVATNDETIPFEQAIQEIERNK